MAAEALEGQLEIAVRHADTLQGQLDAEIASHSDTRANLQRAEAQVTCPADYAPMS